MKKFISVLLSLLMMFSLCLSVSADDGKVAKIGDTEYSTLQEAIDAGEGKTVVLISDVDISNGGVRVNTNTTLDLNGHLIKVANISNGNIAVNNNLTLIDSSDVKCDGTGTGKIYTETAYKEGESDKVIISVNNGATFTMKSGLIDTASFTDNNKDEGQFAIGFPDTYIEEATVIIDGGHVKAGWYAVSGNGNNGEKGADQNIIVNGGILESTSDFAIYHPHKGTTTINGGVVYGASGGVAINRGNLVVNGGTITSKGVGSTGTWGDGTGGLANAAVNINALYGATDVKLNEGKFIAEGNAISLIKNSEYPSSLTITGGTYSSNISEYLSDDLVQNTAGTVVEKPYIASNNGKKI